MDFNTNGAVDPDAAVILLFNYNFATASWIAFLELEHAIPIPDPPIFVNFTAIVPEVDGMKVDSLSNVTLFLNSTDLVATRYFLFSVVGGFTDDACVGIRTGP